MRCQYVKHLADFIQQFDLEVNFFSFVNCILSNGYEKKHGHLLPEQSQIRLVKFTINADNIRYKSSREESIFSNWLKLEDSVW